MATVLEKIRKPFTSAEDKRLAERRDLKEQISELNAKELEFDELRSMIRKLDDRLDRSVAAHQTATQPAQAELAELEREAFRIFADGGDLPEDMATRRSAAIAKREKANEKLETEKELIEKQQRKLRDDLAGESNIKAMIRELRGQLKSARLGNSELTTKLHLAQDDMLWAQKRISRAESKLQEARSAHEARTTWENTQPETNAFGEVTSAPRVNAPEDAEVSARISSELREAEAELDHARELKDAAVAERQRLLDEIEAE